MEQNFITFGSLPACIEKLGDNIEHLYHTACRSVINSELIEYKIEDVYVQFGADEYNQIFVTFFNKFGIESEKFVIRARKLATVVETINKICSKLIKKGFKIMRNKDKKTAAKTAEVSNEVSNVSSEASVNHSGSAETNMLVEFILQRHGRSGNLYEASEFMDVSRLYQAKSSGAVSNVAFNGDNIAIEGAISISFSVAGMNQSELREQLIWALQTVIERNKQLEEPKSAGTEHKAKAKGEVKNSTKAKPFRGKVNEKAVKRFNEAVCKGVNALEPTLKGLSPSASGQKIRCFLNKAAHDSHLKLPDTSGVTLAKNLSQYSIELLLTSCATAECNVPPFLQMTTATTTSSSKSVMRT